MSVELKEYRASTLASVIFSSRQESLKADLKKQCTPTPTPPQTANPIMSVRSGGSDTSSTEARRRRGGAGILDRLRAARGNTKQKERTAVLDVLQGIRFSRTSSSSSSRRYSRGDSDDYTASTSETPSLASTASSGFFSTGSSHIQQRNPMTFKHSEPAQKMRSQDHALPSLSSSSLHSIEERGGRGKRQAPSKPFVDLRQMRTRNDAFSNSSLLVTPLYNAVSSGAPRHVVESLLEQNPSAPSHQNNGGMTPLHCAIERYDTQIDVLLLLLASNPSAAGVRQANGCNSVDLLWKRFIDPADYRSETTKQKAASLRRSFEDIVDAQFAMHRQTRAQHALQENADLKEFWDTAELFIKAACRKNSPSPKAFLVPQQTTRLVHDCVAIDCQPLLIRFAVALHPEQIREYADDQRRLPLHIAATQSPRATKVVLDLYRQAASRTDIHGRLPLHYAIQSGMLWDDGIQDLIRASPKSFTIPDPKTGLPPFMAAACTETPDLTTIFKLLSSNPADLMNYTL